MSKSNAQSPLHRAAQAYARKGFPVFPVKVSDKVPDTRHGFKDASTAPEAITRWWSNGQRNIGLATGNNLVVIDIDVKGDADGKAAMQKLIGELGELPDTLKSRTPSGGEHWLFHYPEGAQIRSSANQVARGVDIRADGGYIVAPPSITNVGEYKWLNKGEIADLPAAWLERLQQPKRQPLPATPRPRFTGDADELAEVRSALQYIDAHDHDTWVQVGLSLAGSFGDSGLAIWNDWSKSATNYSASAINKRWKSFSGSSKTKASIFGMAQAQGWNNPAKKKPKPQADLAPPAGHPAAMPASSPTTPASMPEPEHKTSAEYLDDDVLFESAANVKLRGIEWLWKEFIPQGKITIFAGVAKAGKTTLAMDIAATVSTGGKFPDGTQATRGNVLIFSTEDDPDDTLVPRFMAAGGDRERCFFVNGVKQEGKRRSFILSKDLPMLAERIARHPEKIDLLVLDPIITIAEDSNNATKVRVGLDQLNDIARRLNVAVIGISHYRKSSGNDGHSPDKIMGSNAFVGVARSVLNVHNLPDTDGLKLFYKSVSNISQPDEGFYYSLDQKDVRFEEGGTAHSVGCIQWGSFVEGDELRGLLDDQPKAESKPKQAEAENFLRDLLANGAQLKEEITKQAEIKGIALVTLTRAKKELGIKHRKRFGDGKYEWHLPEDNHVDHQTAHEKGDQDDRDDKHDLDRESFEL